MPCPAVKESPTKVRRRFPAAIAAEYSTLSRHPAALMCQCLLTHRSQTFVKPSESVVSTHKRNHSSASRSNVDRKKVSANAFAAASRPQFLSLPVDLDFL